MELDWVSETNDNGLTIGQFDQLIDRLIDDTVFEEINSSMSVATLRARQTIVTLRHDLAFESGDCNEPLYANLQCRSQQQILEALTIKYGRTTSLNERIEILELIENAELTLSCNHSTFALEEADNLLNADAELTEFQRLRLEWLPGIDLNDCDSLVLELLPNARTAFDIATLSLIKDFCTIKNREAIIDKFIAIFSNALSGAISERVEATELATLLTSVADWNVAPALSKLTAKLTAEVESSLGSRDESALGFSDESALGSRDESSLGFRDESVRSNFAEMQLPSTSAPLTRPVLLVNKIAVAIYARLAALSSRPVPLDIPA